MKLRHVMVFLSLGCVALLAAQIDQLSRPLVALLGTVAGACASVAASAYVESISRRRDIARLVDQALSLGASRPAYDIATARLSLAEADSALAFRQSAGRYAPPALALVAFERVRNAMREFDWNGALTSASGLDLAFMGAESALPAGKRGACARLTGRLCDNVLASAIVSGRTLSEVDSTFPGCTARALTSQCGPYLTSILRGQDWRNFGMMKRLQTIADAVSRIANAEGVHPIEIFDPVIAALDARDELVHADALDSGPYLQRDGCLVDLLLLGILGVGRQYGPQVVLEPAHVTCITNVLARLGIRVSDPTDLTVSGALFQYVCHRLGVPSLSLADALYQLSERWIVSSTVPSMRVLVLINRELLMPAEPKRLFEALVEQQPFRSLARDRYDVASLAVLSTVISRRLVHLYADDCRRIIAELLDCRRDAAYFPGVQLANALLQIMGDAEQVGRKGLRDLAESSHVYSVKMRATRNLMILSARDEDGLAYQQYSRLLSEILSHKGIARGEEEMDAVAREPLQACDWYYINVPFAQPFIPRWNGLGDPLPIW